MKPLRRLISKETAKGTVYSALRHAESESRNCGLRASLFLEAWQREKQD